MCITKTINVYPRTTSLSSCLERWRGQAGFTQDPFFADLSGQIDADSKSDQALDKGPRIDRKDQISLPFDGIVVGIHNRGEAARGWRGTLGLLAKSKHSESIVLSNRSVLEIRRIFLISSRFEKKRDMFSHMSLEHKRFT